MLFQSHGATWVVGDAMVLYGCTVVSTPEPPPPLGRIQQHVVAVPIGVTTARRPSERATLVPWRVLVCFQGLPHPFEATFQSRARLGLDARPQCPSPQNGGDQTLRLLCAYAVSTNRLTTALSSTVWWRRLSAAAALCSTKAAFCWVTVSS